MHPLVNISKFEWIKLKEIIFSNSHQHLPYLYFSTYFSIFIRYFEISEEDWEKRQNIKLWQMLVRITSNTGMKVFSVLLIFSNIDKHFKHLWKKITDYRIWYYRKSLALFHSKHISIQTSHNTRSDMPPRLEGAESKSCERIRAKTAISPLILSLIRA